MTLASQKFHIDKSGLKSSLYQPLDKHSIDKIADAAFVLLAESGMQVHSPTAFEAFKSAGAVVDADTRIVKLPKALVEYAIESNPSKITLCSRDGKNDVILEENRVHYGTGGTAVYVIDPFTGQRRQSITQDVILNARMVNVLENVHLFTINVFPHDVEDRKDIDTNRFFHSLDNTTKHVMGGVYSVSGCKKVVEMAQLIAGSSEELRENPFVSFITLLISPFKIDERYGEMTCYFASEGLPVVVPTEPICGTTSPITLAGNILTHIAETLAGITLVQCVNKGAPGICGSVGSITNLENMGHLGGPIERAMINAGVSQLAQYFKIPLYSTAGTSDAKQVDVQAAYESAMSSLLVAMSGANFIHDIAGLMEEDLTVSYEKLVMDNEILGMCQRVLRGIEVNDDTLALNLMLEKGPAKDFLAETHTVKHMRKEFFMPTLANRDKREEFDTENDALTRAKTFVHKVINVEKKSCLNTNIRQQITETYREIITPSESLEQISSDALELIGDEKE